MDLDKEFQEATIRAKQLPQQSNENLLKLYSLYKQATEGDVTGEKPSNPFDFVNTAKYNAWADLKGLSMQEAKNKYITLVNDLSS